jgi:glycosyltransferase involved in cell wall biosynthesis
MADEMPRIWLAANTTWYVHNFRGRLISSLRASGSDVTVLSPRDAYVSRIESLGARHVHLEMQNTGTNPLLETMTIINILRKLYRERPDAMLTFTPKVNIYCALAARVLNIPLIANVSGLGRGFVRGDWIRTVSRLLYRVAFTHPRFVFFQNADDMAEFVNEDYVPSHRSIRIPGSGIDLERFRPDNRSTGDNEVRFLFLSRLIWDKGVAEYVEAARRLRSASIRSKCRLLGFIDRTNPQAVQPETVRQWHDEGVVEYLGATDDVIPHLAEADCVVLPSYYREGVPRSLLEAASMGLPVITTDMPGCREAVEDGRTGYLCKPRDVADLTEKMLGMVALSGEKRQAMGAAGRDKMVREFDEQKILLAYSDAIATVLAERKRNVRTRA